MKIENQLLEALGVIDSNLEKGLALFTSEEREVIKNDLQVTAFLLVVTALLAVVGIWSTTAAGVAILAGAYTLYWMGHTIQLFVQAHWRIAKSLVPKRPFWTKDERGDVFLFVCSSMLFAIFWYVGTEWSLRYGTEITLAYATFAGWVAVICAGLLLLCMLVFSVRGIRRWKKAAKDNLAE